MIRQVKNYFRKRFKPNEPIWMQPPGKRTGILIYNHIIKEAVPFIAGRKGYISWYACGPTVYDSAHIGHACSYIRLDVIRRIIEKYVNKDVIQVMCVTNMDDKIIQRCRETNTDWRTLTEGYEREFFADMAALNVKRPSFVARATDFVPQIIKFITRLTDNDFAYRTPDGSVYFSINDFGKHGKLRPMAPQSKTANQDENVVAHKKNPADFALWKSAKPDEPYWISPWGIGRPGWHIGCSVMASEFFNHAVDIHSGGADLIFPHHENEESQCCAFHEVEQWVDYWLHTGFLSVKDQKMSKSLGNTLSIKEYIENSSVNYLRMLCLVTPYRSNVDFCGDDIIYSRNLCASFYQFFDDCRAYVSGYSTKGDVNSTNLFEALNETKKVVEDCFRNDFNTKLALHFLTDLMTVTFNMINAEPGNRCVTSVSYVSCYIESVLEFLGLDFSERSISTDDIKYVVDNMENVIDTSVKFRNAVRSVALSMKTSENKDSKEIRSNLLKLCDDFRGNYRHHGIALKDRTDELSTWSYVSLVEKSDSSSEKS